jgi:1,4-dihydroxy-2-naphthoate octaprenyltransferase
LKWAIDWWKTARGPFFIMSLMPVLLGTSITLSEVEKINWTGFLFSIGVVLSCHAGSNLFNDYYDHLSTNDDINTCRSPFNGGSGSIQEGIMGPASVRNGGIVCYAVSLALGILLFVPGNPWGLLFVLTGLGSGFCYSKFPGLSYLGWGELIVGFNFGPLIVLSAYFVQTGRISLLPVIVSIPIGLLVAAVLYINQFPDFEADRAVKKDNLVVRLGLKRALPLYYLLLGTAYLVVVAGIRFQVLPTAAIAVFLTVPLAGAAAYTAAKWYDKPAKILPANAYTVAVSFGVGLLMTAAFLWEALLM